ncbi:MAG: ABC transporter permease [Prevotellaceae bacterium]|nr:ABC transporter permease [Prevotellaceae bacterium]
MIASLAWRNVWRSKVRSVAVLCAAGVGMFAGFYLSAFVSGWLAGAVSSSADARLCPAQMGDTAFLANGGVKAFLVFAFRDGTGEQPSIAMPPVRMAWAKAFALGVNLIFLAALSFGVTSAMLAAVSERARELGMLSAIGMSRGKIFRMVMQETVFLMLPGSLAGLAAGVAAVAPIAESGVDLSFMVEGLPQDAGFCFIVHPLVSAQTVVEIVALAIIAGMLSAVCPALKAMQIKSVKGVRK